jgi:cystathionine gamma-synthase/methionine-gamma-lyase
VVPVVHASAFYFERAEELDQAFDDPTLGSVYTRHGNPTMEAFEAAVAALEGAEVAVAFASGQAALHAALLAAGASYGGRVVAARDLYGGTLGLLGRVFEPLGVETCFVDATDLEQVRLALEEEPAAALLVEGISNPLLKVSDVAALAEIAHDAGALCVVDNTFATPCLLRPLAVGADLVAHSATKYLGGHGDVTGGVVAGSAVLGKRLREVARLVGGILSPAEAYKTLRGMRTLALRFERQCCNAQALAVSLAEHPRVGAVNYPGLPSHPWHEVATRVFEGRGYGAMVSFELAKGGRAEVFAFLDRLRLVTPAPTLGDVASLVLYPAMASHRSLTADQRRSLGISDRLVRISVGIEDPQDIIADVHQALG